MKVILDEQAATLTLVAVSPEDTEALDLVISKLKPEDQLRYAGRGKDPHDPERCIVYLRVGDEKITVVGTTEQDKDLVGLIRELCYYGPASLIFLGETQVDGSKAIITTAERCKDCGANMINLSGCEWKICDACAKKCGHDYVISPIHGGGLDIGVGQACTKCGRVKPQPADAPKKTQLEHHLAVQDTFGVQVVYENGPPYTPMEYILGLYARDTPQDNAPEDV